MLTNLVRIYVSFIVRHPVRVFHLQNLFCNILVIRQSTYQISGFNLPNQYGVSLWFQFCADCVESLRKEYSSTVAVMMLIAIDMILNTAVMIIIWRWSCSLFHQRWSAEHYMNTAQCTVIMCWPEWPSRGFGVWQAWRCNAVGRHEPWQKDDIVLR